MCEFACGFDDHSRDWTVLVVLSVLPTTLLVNWPRLVGDSLQAGESKLLSYLVCYTYPSNVALHIYYR